jgi:hypothetical protein
VGLAEARAFITRHHRHHRPPVGHLFSLGCWEGDELMGVACVGRPVSRVLDARGWVEVTRLAVKAGAPKGAPSMLLAAAVRAVRDRVHKANRVARMAGEEVQAGVRVITYTLASESGASLRGAGFAQDVLSRDCSSVRGRSWSRTGGAGKCKLGPKVRWSRAV